MCPAFPLNQNLVSAENVSKIVMWSNTVHYTYGHMTKQDSREAQSDLTMEPSTEHCICSWNNANKKQTPLPEVEQLNIRSTKVLLQGRPGRSALTKPDTSVSYINYLQSIQKLSLNTRVSEANSSLE